MHAAADRPDHIAANASFHGDGFYIDVPANPYTILPHVTARLYFGRGIDDCPMLPSEVVAKA